MACSTDILTCSFSNIRLAKNLEWPSVVPSSSSSSTRYPYVHATIYCHCNTIPFIAARTDQQQRQQQEQENRRRRRRRPHRRRFQSLLIISPPAAAAAQQAT